MWFWTKRGEHERVITALEHGSVWVWSSADDKSGVRHSVCFSSREYRDTNVEPVGRWVIVARWLDTVREHEQQYPHYNVSGRDCELLS